MPIGHLLTSILVIKVARQSNTYTIEQAKVARQSLVKAFVNEICKLSTAGIAGTIGAQAGNVIKNVAGRAAATFVVDKGKDIAERGIAAVTGKEHQKDPRTQFQQAKGALTGALHSTAFMAALGQDPRNSPMPIKQRFGEEAKVQGVGLAMNKLF